MTVRASAWLELANEKIWTIMYGYNPADQCAVLRVEESISIKQCQENCKNMVINHHNGGIRCNIILYEVGDNIATKCTHLMCDLPQTCCGHSTTGYSLSEG